MSGLRLPVATYRLQFNEGFRFNDATALVPYLYNLGVSDVYASPMLKARKGSTHGYDVIDPTQLNPDLGSEDDFNDLVKALRRQGMGLLLDIVPNHMAACPENLWWRDVQERGKDSPFAEFFDINWLDFRGSEDKAAGYRRFFDIGDLVGIRVEDPQVFEATHIYILKLIAQSEVNGLRIDHIDGLYDPLEYLERLRASTGGVYTVVEKILCVDETLPDTWPVYGTTGYDFTGTLNALFVDCEGLKSLDRSYSRTTSLEKPFRDLVYENKKLVMAEMFPEEIKALGDYLSHLSGHLKEEDAGRALVEITACLPVYRTYMKGENISATDLRYIESAAREAIERKACLEAAMSFLMRVLQLDFPADISAQEKNEWLNFIRRWQQLTGAVMAKGSEDTVLYNYNRLVSLNEVGGSPDTTGLSVEDFHEWNLKRVKRWPHTLNATSTHDTKRSEDVRARISVLSEIPGEWERHLELWMQYNLVKKERVKGQFMPEPNTEVFLYQTLLGAWPLIGEEVPAFKERLKDYMVKAVREAKAITGWLKINRNYEAALLSFIDAILEESPNNRFLENFLSFQEWISFYGALNSLSQVLLKITSPGVPDFYRGTELWDFSLVDPDNRRPVDFNRRKLLLEGFLEKEPSAGDMLASWQDGRIKLYLTWRALNTRRDYLEVFQKGDYIPLKISGEKEENVVAFARRYGNKWVLVAAPRFFTRLCGMGVPPVGRPVWGDSYLAFPVNAPGDWRNVFTGEIIESTGSLLLAGVFGVFPVAMLVNG